MNSTIDEINCFVKFSGGAISEINCFPLGVIYYWADPYHALLYGNYILTSKPNTNKKSVNCAQFENVPLGYTTLKA